jgi:TonB family protein
MRASNKGYQPGKAILVMSVASKFRKVPAGVYVYTLFLFLAALVVAASPAQEASRHVISRAAPVYPELAKKMHLSGKVKIEVEVNPAGSVISAKMVGGNPVFETSAINAVRQWKFEPSQSASKGVITVEFAEQ